MQSSTSTSTIDAEDLAAASFLTGHGHQHQLFDASQLIANSPGDDTEDSRDDDDEKPTGMLREQDRFLPIANVARLMKKSIPKTGKIAKETRECVQECVSEFVSFITSEASDRCHQEKRKTINGEDILFAMSNLGFDNYVEPLKLYLQKYRETMKCDKTLMGGSGSGADSPSPGCSISALGDSSGGGGTSTSTSNSDTSSISASTGVSRVTTLISTGVGGVTATPSLSAMGGKFVFAYDIQNVNSNI